jgi:hypothetical protein
MAIRYHNAVLAACSPENVWQVFRDVDRWPQWNSAIGRASWSSGEPWQKGSTLEIQVANPASITLHPQIEGVAPPNVVHWIGKQMGVKAEILFRFDPDPAGTKIECFQEVTGAPTMFVTDRMKAEVTAVFDRWLESLKSEAERVAQAGEATA